MPNKKTQEGKGLVSGVRQIIFGRDELVRKPLKLMKLHGNKNIKAALIIRAPINKTINAIVKLGTLQGANYDKLYHLYIVLTLMDGTMLRLEKNGSINIETFTRPKSSKAELLNVVIKKPTSVIDAFNNILKGYKGKRDMYAYDSQNNNCQRFINTFLKKNPSTFKNTVAITKFVIQDTAAIFKKSGLFVKLMKGITDIGNKSSVLVGSGKRG